MLSVKSLFDGPVSGLLRVDKEEEGGIVGVERIKGQRFRTLSSSQISSVIKRTRTKLDELHPDLKLEVVLILPVFG